MAVVEKSISLLDKYVGKKIQVVAFGTSYIGILKEVDYDRDFIKIADEKDVVTLDMEGIEAYALVEE